MTAPEDVAAHPSRRRETVQRAGAEYVLHPLSICRRGRYGRWCFLLVFPQTRDSYGFYLEQEYLEVIKYV